MSVEIGYLALLLDAPLQSWGFQSRFQRRTTGLHPTKSGVIGLICAAMGVAKGSAKERELLPKLAELSMTSIAIPRQQASRWKGKVEDWPVRRLEDFHTVLGTRRASGTLNDDPVVTRRQYLLDARFGVILSGDRALLEHVAAALENPTWGVWFGRKSCIPAEPLFRGLHETLAEARKTLIGDTPLEAFTRVTDAPSFAAGTDSYNDVPVSFGREDSSSEGRQFALRRVNVEVGRTAEPGGEPE
ncbi:MAG: type I-E CRISPR-associated protein Cas5/CasD [Acidobacteriota bacterium]|nr:type I-E CRISPR-associated protein Cas5/CasD [Blastocatellia bacterium]MDW8240445.1 type I-E CRISPR-associated protein Cas5/CasD [Acidobacteriota bacterium]